MQPFMFVIHSVPLPKNKNYKAIHKAWVHIWVMGESIESAQDKAFAYIKSFNWNPLRTKYAFQITAEQIASLHPDEARLFQKALLYGIAADFLAVPIREKSPDSPVEFDDP